MYIWIFSSIKKFYQLNPLEAELKCELFFFFKTVRPRSLLGYFGTAFFQKREVLITVFMNSRYEFYCFEFFFFFGVFHEFWMVSRNIGRLWLTLSCYDLREPFWKKINLQFGVICFCFDAT